MCQATIVDGRSGSICKWFPRNTSPARTQPSVKNPGHSWISVPVRNPPLQRSCTGDPIQQVGQVHVVNWKLAALIGRPTGQAAIATAALA